jgi:transposase
VVVGCARRPARTVTINRLHRLLVELVPGGAKKALTARQARALLTDLAADDAAGDVVRETRRQLAGELVDELEVIDARIKTAKKQLAVLVTETGSGLMRLNGIGPSGTARLLGDIGDVSRFPTKAHFASWNGTAPLDASSGEQTRHRLSRAGNRRINRALHIMAIVQLRHHTAGRRYYDRRVAEGKTPMEAMRALKRRLSDVVYRQLVNDQKHQPATDAEPDPQAERTGSEGHLGAATRSSAAGSNPNRRFGQVTFRARHPRRYPDPRCEPRPYFQAFAPPLTTEGCQSRVISVSVRGSRCAVRAMVRCRRPCRRVNSG